MKEQAPKDMRRIRAGRQGENLAVAYLQKQGYRILTRNYRCFYGEADIVAKEGDTLVFVEVKTRKTETFGVPQESVGYLKQKKLSKISLCYIQEKHLQDCNARFDVVAVRLSPQEDRIELIRNAFNLMI